MNSKVVQSNRERSNPIVVVVPFLVVLALWNLTQHKRHSSHNIRTTRELEDENPDDVQHKDMWWLGVIMSLSASFGTVRQRFSLLMKSQNSERLERGERFFHLPTPLTNITYQHHTESTNT